MSNFSIGNGCNSCSEVGGSFNSLPPMGQLLNNDNTSNYLSNMVSQNVANNNNNNNMYYNNNNGYNSANNNLNRAANNVVNNANQVNALMNASSNGRNAIAVPNTINVNANANTANTGNNRLVSNNVVANNKGNGKISQSAVYFIMMGFVFVAALAWNDTIRYFINQSIKFNSGNPSYYVFYAALVTVLAAVVFNYALKN